MESSDMFSVFDSEPTSSTLSTARSAAPSGASPTAAAAAPAAAAAAAVDTDTAPSTRSPALVSRKRSQPSSDASAQSVIIVEESPTAAEQAAAGVISVSHEVAMPPDGGEPTPGMQNPQYPPETPAREYPFVLDPFQQMSIACIERCESVLVSAHTSAGKTVVAEYAIALSLREQQRVIYTSPIKALSNQKYRELYAEFNDVGLMTGDVTINPNASCLVMTTEILRSMLYRGSEIMREVGWVIFDEIHYMRDKERGVVWEETIILLPDKVHYVFLSATIPNALEFGSWIARTHSQPCHVVYTEKRPTPLQHYVFPAGGSGLHLVVDEKGTFREENFQRAISSLSAFGGGASQRRANAASSKGGGPSDIYKIVKMVMERDYQPVIIFCFSKKECEGLALQMGKLDFLTAEEKAFTQTIFDNAIDSLEEDDKQLPQIQHILPLLKRGTGIHHSGLLPILKEVIEILFQEGLLKALFATETFSMGLNMPAKTVIFTSVRKFDGKDFRYVTGGEYIQMSGRAGRRGLDDRGIVILMVDEKLDPHVAKGMLKGVAMTLQSAFHLGYNMLLNLIRVEGINPEALIQQSFHQFQSDSQLPRLRSELLLLQAEEQSIHFGSKSSSSSSKKQKKEKKTSKKGNEMEDSDDDSSMDSGDDEGDGDDDAGLHESLFGEFHYLKLQLTKLTDKFQAHVMHPAHSLPFIQPGRLIHIGQRWNWGVVVNYQRKSTSVSALTSTSAAHSDAVDGLHDHYIVDVLVRADMSNPRVPKPAKSVIGTVSSGGGKGKPSSLKKRRNSSGKQDVEEVVPGEDPDQNVVLPFMLSLVDQLSAIRLHLPNDLRSADARDALAANVREVKRRFPDGLPLLDPVKDMDIKDEAFKTLIKKIETLESKMLSPKFAAARTSKWRKQYKLFLHKLDLQKQIQSIRKQLKEGSQVVMVSELKAMKRVLRRLNFIDKDGLIQVKGRVACEINASDSLLLTELMFNGVYNELSVEQCVALLSAFVFAEKSKANIKLKEELAKPLRQLHEAARRIATVSVECKIADMDVEEYVGKFTPSLMGVVYAWVHGARFSEICQMTDVFEGTVIRCMRRLEELLRQLAQAAKAIGNGELEAKFSEGIVKIKRDIVFAASLYL